MTKQHYIGSVLFLDDMSFAERFIKRNDGFCGATLKHNEVRVVANNGKATLVFRENPNLYYESSVEVLSAINKYFKHIS